MYYFAIWCVLCPLGPFSLAPSHIWFFTQHLHYPILHFTCSYRLLEYWIPVLFRSRHLYEPFCCIDKLTYGDYACVLNVGFKLLQNAVLCILFGISLLAGGISNSVYSSDNRDDYDNSLCSYTNRYYVNVVDEVCDDLQTVYEAQAAAAVSLGSYCNHSYCNHSYHIPYS